MMISRFTSINTSFSSSFSTTKRCFSSSSSASGRRESFLTSFPRLLLILTLLTLLFLDYQKRPFVSAGKKSEDVIVIANDMDGGGVGHHGHGGCHKHRVKKVPFFFPVPVPHHHPHHHDYHPHHHNDFHGLDASSFDIHSSHTDHEHGHQYSGHEEVVSGKVISSDAAADSKINYEKIKQIMRNDEFNRRSGWFNQIMMMPPPPTFNREQQFNQISTQFSNPYIYNNQHHPLNHRRHQEAMNWFLPNQLTNSIPTSFAGDFEKPLRNNQFYEINDQTNIPTFRHHPFSSFATSASASFVPKDDDLYSSFFF